MVPQQPCIDKYGSSVCDLPRFEFRDHQTKSEMMREAKEILQDVTKLQKRTQSNSGSNARPKFSTKRNSNLPPSDRKEEQKQQRKEERREEQKETTDFTPYRQPMPKLRPNTESLSVEERAKAQMVRAGKTAYKKGFAAAQAEMDAGSLRG